MAEVQPLAKRAIEAAAAHRASVSKLEILKNLRVGMSAADARAAGVMVLREEGGVMAVGAFTIPRLDASIVQPPKSESVLPHVYAQPLSACVCTTVASLGAFISVAAAARA